VGLASIGAGSLELTLAYCFDRCARTGPGGLTAASGADKLAAAASAAPSTAAAKEGKEMLEPVEGLFRLRTCHISVRTQALVEMVYQTLSECRSAPPLGYAGTRVSWGSYPAWTCSFRTIDFILRRATGPCNCSTRRAICWTSSVPWCRCTTRTRSRACRSWQ